MSCTGLRRSFGEPRLTRACCSAEDTLEHELMRELENGRLVRLLTKFGFINERPEYGTLVFSPLRARADHASNFLRFDHDPRWAETGDRYLIKLFRDYVFHQVDETGRPVTDLSHVLTALNKVRTSRLCQARLPLVDDRSTTGSWTPASTRRLCSSRATSRVASSFLIARCALPVLTTFMQRDESADSIMTSAVNRSRTVSKAHSRTCHGAPEEGSFFPRNSILSCNGI